MSDPYQQELDDVYLMRRLGTVRRAEEISPSMQLDLATSSLSNGELEEAVQQFGAQPRTGGWGFSNVFEEMLTREPKRAAVGDLAKMQQSLKEQGYLSPDTPVDGVWGPESSAAFAQFDRDNEEAVRSGRHPLAATVQDGVNLLGNTVPSRIFQGIIGTAKGIAEQTPETFARGGVAGGAASGAAIGAAATAVFGPGAAIGAGVGAVVGAAAGLLSGLFDDDDEDTNKSFMDLLHPFNEGEWTDPKAFFEDLGYVASVASMIQGAGLVRTAAAGAAAGGGLRATLTSLGPVDQPGFVARLMGSAKGGAALGGAAGGAAGLAKGEDFGDVLGGAALGAAAGGALGGSPAGKIVKDAAARYGLNRIVTNPLIQTVNKGYTGMSVANIGGRYLGGLGGGEGDKEGSTIAEAIEKAPKLPEWVDYTAGMILFPEKIFPVGFKQAGSAFRKVLGDTNLYPYVHVGQTRDEMGKVLSVGQARETAARMLGSNPGEQAVTDTYLRLSYGIHRRAQEKMRTLGDVTKRADYERLSINARSEVVRELKAQGADGKLDLASDLIGYSHANALDDTKGPMAYAGWLKGLEGKGSGLSKLEGFRTGLRRAEELTLDARAGRLEYEILGTAPKYVTRGSLSRSSLQAELRKLKAEQKRLAGKRLADTTVKLERSDELSRLQSEIERVQTSLKEVGKPKAKEAETTFVVARDDYITENDHVKLADEYNSLVGEVFRADDAAAKFSLGDNSAEALRAREAAHVAQEKMNELVGGLYKRDILDDELMKKALAPGKPDKKGDHAFSKFMKERARYSGRDVLLDDPRAAELTEKGYKLIATGEDMLYFSDVAGGAAAREIGDYTKRAAFFETIGLSPFRHTDDSISSLKRGHQEAELGEAVERSGLQMNGRQALSKIHAHLSAKNESILIDLGTGLGSKLARPLATPIEAARYKIDIRQLQLDDIITALKLDDPIHKMKDPYRAAEDIYESIKRGSAMGGEVSVRHAKDSVRMLGMNLRVNGLSGFSDWMRTFHIEDPIKTGAIVGGVAGAGIGSEDGEGLPGAIEGAIFGSLAGAGVGGAAKLSAKAWPKSSPFAKGTYGYLPDKLHNANMALRYSLSFTFDAGRYTEQAMIANAKYNLPAIFRHKKYIQKRFGPEHGGDVDKAWQEALDVLDDSFGHRWGQAIDDIERRVVQKGMLGFSPREADAAYALLLQKRGFNRGQIKEAIQNISRYGSGRTGAEKSANFIVFPFSFSKKFLSTLGDWAIAEPARAMLIHEGLRRYHESSMDERFGDYFEKYMPLAQELKRINNLAYGLSPGRFFLEGMSDNKTLLGKVGQSLASIFVPSGAATPVAQGVGKSADFAVNLFVPVVLTGEDTENFVEIFDSYSPAIRDLQSFWEAGAEQVTAIGERGTAERVGGAPYYQFRHYLDEKRALRAEYEDVAESMGYSSVAAFLESPVGSAFRSEVDQREMELVERYPTGARMSSEFSSSSIVDAKAKAELADDPNRSPGEEMIQQLLEMEEEGRYMATTLGLDSASILQMLTGDIREIATQWSNDRRFADLYDRFFAPVYGPIRRVA